MKLTQMDNIMTIKAFEFCSIGICKIKYFLRIGSEC